MSDQLDKSYEAFAKEAEEIKKMYFTSEEQDDDTEKWKKLIETTMECNRRGLRIAEGAVQRVTALKKQLEEAQSKKEMTKKMVEENGKLREHAEGLRKLKYQMFSESLDLKAKQAAILPRKYYEKYENYISKGYTEDILHLDRMKKNLKDAMSKSSKYQKNRATEKMKKSIEKIVAKVHQKEGILNEKVKTLEVEQQKHEYALNKDRAEMEELDKMMKSMEEASAAFDEKKLANEIAEIQKQIKALADAHVNYDDDEDAEDNDLSSEFSETSADVDGPPINSAEGGKVPFKDPNNFPSLLSLLKSTSKRPKKTKPNEKVPNARPSCSVSQLGLKRKRSAAKSLHLEIAPSPKKAKDGQSKDSQTDPGQRNTLTRRNSMLFHNENQNFASTSKAATSASTSSQSVDQTSKSDSNSKQQKEAPECDQPDLLVATKSFCLHNTSEAFSAPSSQLVVDAIPQQVRHATAIMENVSPLALISITASSQRVTRSKSQSLFTGQEKEKENTEITSEKKRGKKKSKKSSRKQNADKNNVNSSEAQGSTVLETSTSSDTSADEPMMVDNVPPAPIGNEMEIEEQVTENQVEKSAPVVEPQNDSEMVNAMPENEKMSVVNEQIAENQADVEMEPENEDQRVENVEMQCDNQVANELNFSNTSGNDNNAADNFFNISSNADASNDDAYLFNISFKSNEEAEVSGGDKNIFDKSNESNGDQDNNDFLNFFNIDGAAAPNDDFNFFNGGNASTSDDAPFF